MIAVSESYQTGSHQCRTLKTEKRFGLKNIFILSDFLMEMSSRHFSSESSSHHLNSEPSKE